MNDAPAPSRPPVILAGICGGIAACKAAEVVSRLAKDGCDLRVAMTEAAARFVTPTTFASLSRRRVLTAMFPPADETDGDDLFPHLYPASRADVFLLMPATADMMAKIAAGVGDDVVCCSALALRPECIRIFCPAMNSNMWLQPVVQRNAEALRALGWIQVGPAMGALACGASGVGRMAEPSEILEAVADQLAATRSLAGRRVLILSGPTREHLDPVRYLGNASSGRMGQALAEAARRMGATVTFVTGPVEPERLPAEGGGVDIRRVVSADEMRAAALEALPDADIVVCAAAVADYRPARASGSKGPKSKSALKLDLVPTPDIASEIGQRKRPGQVVIGFALESGDGLEKARRKMKTKRFDAIVLNGPASMGADTAEFTVLRAKNPEAAECWGAIGKAECAGRILSVAATLLD